MNTLSRWIAPLVFAAGLGAVALAIPAPAHAQDDLTRVLVDVADVVIRGGTPYYRHGDYGYDDRLYLQRDRYGRPLYYRSVPRHVTHYRSGPPYGKAYGYHRNGPGQYRDAKCNKHGKCKVEYYNPRYDRDRHARHDRYWDGHRGDRDRDRGRWRDHDDD